MTTEPDASAVYAGLPGQPRRETKQSRSALQQHRITQGAIRAISRYGIAQITHRRIAKEAHVSLAATTYYYPSKHAIIATASQAMLSGYVDAFRRFIVRHEHQAQEASLQSFVMRLVLNAVGRHREGTLAWCEIILNAARQPDLREVACEWFATLKEVWRDIALLLHHRDVDEAATSAIDTVIGFLFLVVPLGLNDAEVRALLTGTMEARAPRELDGHVLHHAPARSGKKAEETRRRILDAAVDILVTDGAETLTFQRVALAAGLTVAAPTYYFTTISALLDAAQRQMFDNAKLRYRAVMHGVELDSLNMDQLIDLTTTVFLREATEFREPSLASFPVYIQSSRDPGLRGGLWAINQEQWHRWSQTLACLLPQSQPFHAWAMYALFTGKLIRSFATGADTAALARARSEFAYDLVAISEGRHWITDP